VRKYFLSFHGKGSDGYGIPVASINTERSSEGVPTDLKCIGNLDIAAERDFITTLVAFECVEWVAAHLALAQNCPAETQFCRKLQQMDNRAGEIDDTVAKCIGVSNKEWKKILIRAWTDYDALIESLTKEADSRGENHVPTTVR
jgi:hypothetical protein